MGLTKTRASIIGAIIVLLGLVLLLQAFDVIGPKPLNDSLGSIIVMAVGVMLFVRNPRSWPWTLMIFLVGLFDMIENQQWPMFENNTPWEFVWPFFLILLGIWFLSGKKMRGTPKATV